MRDSAGLQAPRAHPFFIHFWHSLQTQTFIVKIIASRSHNLFIPAASSHRCYDMYRQTADSVLHPLLMVWDLHLKDELLIHYRSLALYVWLRRCISFLRFSLAFLSFALPVSLLWWCNSSYFGHYKSYLFLAFAYAAFCFSFSSDCLSSSSTLSKMLSAVSASPEYRAFTFLHAVFLISVFFLPRRRAKNPRR